MASSAGRWLDAAAKPRQFDCSKRPCQRGLKQNERERTQPLAGARTRKDGRDRYAQRPARIFGLKSGVGYFAGGEITTGQRNICIGSGSVGFAAMSDQLRIGNSNSLTTISASLLTGDIIFPSTASAAVFSGSTYYGDGSNLTGITAATSLTQSLFVSPSGNNSTAVVGDIHLPFQTIIGATGPNNS